MKLHLDKLPWAARCIAAGLITGIGVAAPAAAQQEGTVGTIPVQESAAAGSAQDEATKLDTIEVTGSRIKRTDFETAQPVLVVTREDIARTGITNIGDLIQELPMAGSALSRSFNNGGNGQTEIDLRNLGSTRTLVLVNGHRWVGGTSLGDSAVDMNTIPVSIIERIEVLKDGASAIYGSDAIAGVVNIITRKDYTGAEFRSQYGAFEDGKGAQQMHGLSLGTTTGRTSMFFDLNYTLQDELRAGDRELSSMPKANTGLSRGSIFTPGGHPLFIPEHEIGAALNAVDPNLCPDLVPGIAGANFIPPTIVGGLQLCNMALNAGETITEGTTLAEAALRYHPWDPQTDPHNYAPVNYLLTPMEQTSAFGQLSHQVLDNLNWQTQFLMTQSETVRQLAESPLLFGNLTFPPFNQTYVDRTNIYNPFGQDIGRGTLDPTNAVGVAPGTGIVGRRFMEAGPRILERENRVAFVKTQLLGDFDLFQRFFTWDVGASYGRNKQSNIHKGDLNMEHVRMALGPHAACLADPNCVPLNIFGRPGTAGEITQEQLDYVTYQATSEGQYSVKNAFANIGTEIAELDGILAGPLGVAFGLEYRSEAFSETPDPFVELGISSTNGRERTVGGYNVREVYAELAVPLVRDLPFVQELELSLAGRHTEYNTFDPKTTGKLGLRYKPFDDLLVRGTYSQAFRAPNLSELFLGSTDSFPSLGDPCAGPAPGVPRDQGTTVDQNCDAEGVSDSASQLSSQILTRFGGNRDLEPETADTFTAGVVYSPSYVPDLNVYVDYFNIKLDNFIEFVQPNFILESCYERPEGSPRPETCDFVERNSDGSVSFIRALSYNFAKLHTSGVDISFDYLLPVQQWVPGTIKLMYDSQYLIQYDRYVKTATGGSQLDPLYGPGKDAEDQPLPRYKANLSLGWGYDNWGASWTTRFIKGTTENCDDGLSPSLQSFGVCSDPDPDLTDGKDDSKNTYKDIFYHNVQLTYAVPSWNTDLAFGVQNVLDQDPPISYSAFANSFPATLYEAPGSRAPYLRLKVGF